jgi:hypothetical protein
MADSADIEAGQRGDTASKQGGRVKLLTLADLDGRTLAARHVHQTRAEVIADLGGDERLSTLEHGAVNNVALTLAMVQDVGARWLQGQDVDPGSVATLVNAFNRSASILGWHRRAKDVSPDIYSIAASKGEGK